LILSKALHLELLLPPEEFNKILP